MPIFQKTEESSTLWPVLGAAGLSAGAIAAEPLSGRLAEYLNSQAEHLQRARTQILDAKMRGHLVDAILDKNLRGIPVVIDPSLKGSQHILVNSQFAPSREVALKALNSGGVMLAGGEKMPMSKFIEKSRQLGSYIGLAPNEQYIPVLAHELGHAAGVSSSESLRSTKAFRGLDAFGRKVLRQAHLVAPGAALAALTMDSDNPLKWGIPAALLATQAPLLYEEHMASRAGLRGLEALNKQLTGAAPAAVGPGAGQAIAEEAASSPAGRSFLAELNARIATGQHAVPVQEAAEASSHLRAPLITKDTLDSARKILRSSFGTYGARAAGLVAAPLLAIQAKNILSGARDE